MSLFGTHSVGLRTFLQNPSRVDRTMKDSRQAEGDRLSGWGEDQEEIIQAVPLTARKEVASTLACDSPHKSKLRSFCTILRGQATRSVLGTLTPQSSETSPPPPPSGFSQGESVMKKRKREEERDDEVGEQQALPLTEPLKTKSPSKKEKSKSGQALQKAASNVSHKWKHRNNEPKIPWSCAFSVEGRPIDEDDSVVKGNEVRGGQVADAIGKALLLPRDMKIWQ
uniref:Uncharacterized protein n=1 Tax=Fagus sylvatica TaxID=28930 RepID=A0A2N9GL38_FAGSY